jgi:hypothetical protein
LCTDRGAVFDPASGADEQCDLVDDDQDGDFAPQPVGLGGGKRYFPDIGIDLRQTGDEVRETGEVPNRVPGASIRHPRRRQREVRNLGDALPNGINAGVRTGISARW